MALAVSSCRLVGFLSLLKPLSVLPLEGGHPLPGRWQHAGLSICQPLAQTEAWDRLTLLGLSAEPEPAEAVPAFERNTLEALT